MQDINDIITYILKSEAEQLKHLIDEWENNISHVEFDIFITEEWNGLIYFNEPADYSNEKIFDINFVNTVCDQLNTDKVIFSISRRYRMQMTSYYNNFTDHEKFFLNHFNVWKDSALPDEAISEYILIGEKNKGVMCIADLGFRMNLFNKDGQYLLSYSVFDSEDSLVEDKKDFEEIMEKRREQFIYK